MEEGIAIYGFTIDIHDLMRNDGLVLSCGLLTTESLFIAAYLLKVCHRLSTYDLVGIDEIWQTKICCRLYGAEGGSNSHAEIWVEDRAIWVGISVDQTIKTKAKLNAKQLQGLISLSDALESVFK
ncbi:MAG: hypothetical protein Q8S55_18625 [Methylococcaceae bacterium]|nr:hypothetical protein [Methylococcaceae bacterium]